MRWLACLAMLVGCYSPRSLHCAVECLDDDGCPSGLRCGPDQLCHEGNSACGEKDAGTITPEGMVDTCLGVMQPPPYTLICPTPADIGPPTTIAATINTDTGCSYTTNQGLGVSPKSPELCVISHERIEILTKIRVAGLRPLVLYARTVIDIGPGGSLDLNGSVNPSANSNVNDPDCDGNNGGDGGASLSGPGGAGATFRGLGGAGGMGAVPAPNADPIDQDTLRIRGGCRGGTGGLGGPNQLAGGAGGNGGGAVYLVAPMIRIDGAINASGGGAARALMQQSGGGGGGSGGMIVIWSQVAAIAPTAQIFALGGGGGPGAAQSGAAVGAGNIPTMTTMPAMSSAGGGGGGDGGAGGSDTTASGGPGMQSSGVGGGGGGGGGGGVGHIKIIPIQTNTVPFAPNPS